MQATVRRASQLLVSIRRHNHSRVVRPADWSKQSFFTADPALAAKTHNAQQLHVVCCYGPPGAKKSESLWRLAKQGYSVLHVDFVSLLRQQQSLPAVSEAQLTAVRRSYEQQFDSLLEAWLAGRNGVCKANLLFLHSHPLLATFAHAAADRRGSLDQLRALLGAKHAAHNISWAYMDADPLSRLLARHGRVELCSDAAEKALRRGALREEDEEWQDELAAVFDSQLRQLADVAIASTSARQAAARLLSVMGVESSIR